MSFHDKVMGSAIGIVMCILGVYGIDIAEKTLSKFLCGCLILFGVIFAILTGLGVIEK